jgi:hypothetical protein
MEDDKEGCASSDSFTPLQVPGGLAHSDSEKAEALVNSLEAVSAAGRPVGPGSY